jgi:FMN-dependent NADH-azoreductase
MAVLLHLDSSPLSSSITRELTAEFTAAWSAAHPESSVIHRDLTQNPPAPIDAAWIGASYTPADARTPEQNAILSTSEQLVSELEQADEYVFGVAMHNFSIPSTLKLWIDQVARVGRTFAYGPNGPEGLLKNKKATVIIASGGNYVLGTPLGALNFVEPYLKTILGFLGITNVEFVTAGGAAQLNSGKVDRSTFLKPSVERIRNLAA